MANTLIDLLRHGEPEGGRLYRGHNIDDPLSDRGWQQLWAAVGEDCPWQRILTSPLQRCSAFAQALSGKHGMPVETIHDLREVGFGSWEGRSPDDIKRNDPDEYQAFYQDPVNARPQGAEDLCHFGRRVANAIDAMVEQFSGEHVLVIAHAGVIRAAIGHVLDAPPTTWYRARVDTGGMSRIQHNELGFALVFHNRGPM